MSNAPAMIANATPRGPAPPRPTFLVIDDNADSRFLLVKTLLRKYPGAAIHEAQSSETALACARGKDLSAIVSHRTTETAGIALLRDLRAVNPHVPLVMVSSVDRAILSAAAGADRFLAYDEWLRIGTVVEELIAAKGRAACSP
jgi:DNA-binding NtrC family response regulator